MKRAVIDGAITEEGHRHTVGLQQLESVAGSCCLQNAWSHDPARPHESHFRREQVHAATSAARAAGLAAVELGYQLARRNPLGQRMAVAPMSTEDDVVGP